MNLFEEVHLPKLWKDAGCGVIQNILARELNDYHMYAKKPDSGENFRRFYRHIEPLHVFLAHKAVQEWSSGTSRAGTLIQHRINSYSRSLDVESFFRRCNKIAVLKGTIDLAHGDVLKKQIKNLSINEKPSVGVVFIDYASPDELSIDEDLLDGLNCLFLGSVKSLKDRYLIIAHGITTTPLGAPHSKEIIWWGIPFGMIFVFTLSRLMFLGGKSSLKDGNESKAHVFARSLLTVKHHFSFSNRYVDRIYTSTPLVGGFEEIARPKLIQFKPSFYSEDELKGSSSSLSHKESDIVRRLWEMKSAGSLLVSSASRVEKTDNKKYLSAVMAILESNSASCLVCFGKKMTPVYQHMMHKYGENRIIFVGWLSPKATVSIISILDLFLDPFPFGAGMTFASAAYQKIPIVSTSEYVTVSPSSISIIFSCYKSGSVRIATQQLVDDLFGSSSSLSERAIARLSQSSHASSEELKGLVSDIFVRSSISVLSPKLS